MKEEAKRWMNKAEDDLRKGKDNFSILICHFDF